MKQITIYDLLNLIIESDLNKYVFFDSKYKRWYLCKNAPIIENDTWSLPKDDFFGAFNLSSLFDIAPFDGDWKDSLIKIDHFHQQEKMVKEEE